MMLQSAQPASVSQISTMFGYAREMHRADLPLEFKDLS